MDRIKQQMKRTPQAKAYPDDVGQIIDEVSSDDAPNRELARLVENFDNYDTIYLGYPIWMGTLPPMVQQFLESHDFIPFMAEAA